MENASEPVLQNNTTTELQENDSIQTTMINDQATLLIEESSPQVTATTDANSTKNETPFATPSAERAAFNINDFLCCYVDLTCCEVEAALQEYTNESYSTPPMQLSQELQEFYEEQEKTPVLYPSSPDTQPTS